MKNEQIKEIYNRKAGTEYEVRRWKETPLLRAGYRMTRHTIERHLLQSSSFYFTHCLEVGPGPGTWTKLFIEKFPRAHFDLIDISDQMLKQARNVLKEKENIRYIGSDFLKFEPDRQYDFFFSSRTLEYISEKPAAVNKIFELLEAGKRGFIITKTPHYTRARLRGRKFSRLHRGQVIPRDLRYLLEKRGFLDVNLYPATIHVPLINSLAVNQLFYRIFGGSRLNRVSEFFSESYCVIFRKP